MQCASSQTVTFCGNPRSQQTAFFSRTSESGISQTQPYIPREGKRLGHQTSRNIAPVGFELQAAVTGVDIRGATAYAGTKEKRRFDTQETNRSFPSPPELRVCFGTSVTKHFLVKFSSSARFKPNRGGRVEKQKSRETISTWRWRLVRFCFTLPAFFAFFPWSSENSPSRWAWSSFLSPTWKWHISNNANYGGMGNRGMPFEL